jgi:hypothetical protein
LLYTQFPGGLHINAMPCFATLTFRDNGLDSWFPYNIYLKSKYPCFVAFLTIPLYIYIYVYIYIYIYSLHRYVYITYDNTNNFEVFWLYICTYIYTYIYTHTYIYNRGGWQWNISTRILKFNRGSMLLNAIVRGIELSLLAV